MKILIQPLSKLVIQRDPLEPKNEICLEQFHQETLRWKKTKARVPLMELHRAKQEFISQGKAPAGGWIEVQNTGNLDEMISQAMKKLKEKV